jgi:hypothetical protein
MLIGSSEISRYLDGADVYRLLLACLLNIHDTGKFTAATFSL